MSTLVIRKKSLKTWEHYLDDRPLFISSKFFFNTPEGFKFQIVEEGKATLGAIAIEDITLFDDSTGGGAETFATVTELSIRLEALDYTGHYRNGSGSGLSNQRNQNNITFTNVNGDFFGTAVAPRTGALTIDTAGAVLGGNACIFYNNATLNISPTPDLVVGTFAPNELNTIFIIRAGDGFLIANIVNGVETPVIPLAPTSLAVGTPTSTTIPLTWVKSVSGLMTEYRVYDDGVLLQTFVGDVDAGTLTGLTPSTTYTNLTVRAFNGTSESPSSNAVDGTTASPPAYVRITNVNSTLDASLTYVAGTPDQIQGSTSGQLLYNTEKADDFSIRTFITDVFNKSIAIGVDDENNNTNAASNWPVFVFVLESYAIKINNAGTVDPNVPTTVTAAAGNYIRLSRASAGASMLLHYYNGTTETLIHTFAADATATRIKARVMASNRRLYNLEVQ
jgi:hypothetical protein